MLFVKMNGFSGVEAGFAAAFSSPRRRWRTLLFVPSAPTTSEPVADVSSSKDAVMVFLPSSEVVVRRVVSFLLYYTYHAPSASQAPPAMNKWQLTT